MCKPHKMNGKKRKFRKGMATAHGWNDLSGTWGQEARAQLRENEQIRDL